MQAYLNRHFVSWVAKLPKLRKLSQELQGDGYPWLGDVIQLTEEQIRSYPSATDANVALLKEDLAGVGLRLGMKTPQWDRPTFTHRLR